MSSLKVSSFGAYVTSWKIGEREVLYQGSELKRGGIPLLFPNFDVGEPLPRHGFGRLTQWQLIVENESFCHLRLTDSEISPEYRQIYPHKFIADLKITVADNQLDYSLEVQNLSDIEMPLAPALHPYWPVDHQEKNKIVIKNFSKFSPSNTNWEQNPPDDTYDFIYPLEIQFPKYSLKISDLSSNFKTLQVWSQNSTMSDFNFVCFEPATKPKNGINTDPIILSPKNSTKFHLLFEVTFR